MAVTTATRTHARSVSEELAPVVARLLGRDLPIGLRAWDGSAAGPPDPPVTVVVHRPEALQHLVWAPGELGLARAPRSHACTDTATPAIGMLRRSATTTTSATTSTEVRDVHSLREHYARTLRAWSANLDAQWDDAQRMVGPGRARVWRLHVAGSALGFEQARIAIHQVLAVRPHPDGHSDVAATRAGFEVDVNALAE